MFSWDKTGDRVAIVQMNAELRHAQLELLSAQCATDRLRLRFSAEDIALHAQRDVLRKALSSANALSEYYNYIAQQVPDPESIATPGGSSANEAKVRDAIARVAHYLHEQREKFRPVGRPLDEHHRHSMMPFFSPSLLDQARIVVLDGRRVPNPPFYAEAKAQGFITLPEFTHMTSLTFEDVIVFHGEIASRWLFHGLVHAAVRGSRFGTLHRTLCPRIHENPLPHQRASGSSRFHVGVEIRRRSCQAVLSRREGSALG